MSQTLTLRFEPLGRTIEFVDCPELGLGFQSILRGWTVSEVAVGNELPLVSFRRERGTYVWKSEVAPVPRGWMKDPPRDAFEGVCDFHYYFCDWIAAEHRQTFCVHAGAVEFDAGLVVFPSIQHAGKSTLVTQLACTGRRIFCDDVLLIDAPRRAGVAIGLLPRLRLPLPAKASAGYRSFVAERRGLSDESHMYLELRDGEIAPFGARSPVAAIVSLAREKRDRQATLDPLPVATAVKHLIDQNFAEEIPVTEIFEQLYSLANAVPRFLLRYSNLDDASDLLASKLNSLPRAVG